MTREPFALYVHIPFCGKKCPYCDFNTYAVARAPEETYIPALVREFQFYASDPRFKGREIKSVFWGGGTPSLISAAGIKRVMDFAQNSFGLRDGSEVTLETNPLGMTLESFAAFRDAGINRISLGAQSFNPKYLGLLGRDHSPEEVVHAVQYANAAGMTSVSLDILFGVPNQTVEELRSDVVQAAALPIQHISTYSLTIEKGTPFFQRRERGLLDLPPEEIVLEMLNQLPTWLDSYGFSRYEISNYAKPNHESKHNLSYWNGDDYLGLGAGAHSFVRDPGANGELAGVRWSNCALPNDYSKRVVDGDAISWRENLDRKALIFEFFFLGLRKIAGVDLEDFRHRFGESELRRYDGVIQELVDAGKLSILGSCIKLTPEGIAVADSITERFLVDNDG